jgi:hypothetical protein
MGLCDPCLQLLCWRQQQRDINNAMQPATFLVLLDRWRGRNCSRSKSENHWHHNTASLDVLWLRFQRTQGGGCGMALWTSYSRTQPVTMSQRCCWIFKPSLMWCHVDRTTVVSDAAGLSEDGRTALRSLETSGTIRRKKKPHIPEDLNPWSITICFHVILSVPQFKQTRL